jgi:hypothetical protein
MVDVLEHYAKQNSSEEVHEVVKTAVIVKDQKAYRIEVWKCYSNPSIKYTTSCCAPEEIDGKTVWVNYPLSWTNRDDADSAFAQALSFLPKAQRATAS